jgi:hypothetical protein
MRHLCLLIMTAMVLACDPPCTLNADCDDGLVCIDGSCGSPLINAGEGEEGEGEEGEGEGEGEEGEGEGEEGEGEEGEGELDVCGDNRVTGAETCDDGDEDDFDGCRDCQVTSTTLAVVAGEVPALAQTLQVPTGVAVGEDGASLLVLDAFGVYRMAMTITAGVVQLGAVRRLVDLRTSRAELSSSPGVLLPKQAFPGVGIAELNGHIYFADNGTLWEVPSVGGRLHGAGSRALLVPQLGGLDDETQSLQAGNEPDHDFPIALITGGVVAIDGRLFVLANRGPFRQVVEVDVAAQRVRVFAGLTGSSGGTTGAQQFQVDDVLGFAGLGNGEAMWITKRSGVIRRHRITMSTGALNTLTAGGMEALLASQRGGFIPMAAVDDVLLMSVNVDIGSEGRSSLWRVNSDDTFTGLESINGQRSSQATALSLLPGGAVVSARLFPSRIEQLNTNGVGVVVAGDERAIKQGNDNTLPIDAVARGANTTVVLSDGVVWRIDASGQMTRIIGTTDCGVGNARVTVAVAVDVDVDGSILLGQSDRLCRVTAGVATIVATGLPEPTSMVVGVDNRVVWATANDVLNINLADGSTSNARGALPASNYSDVYVQASGTPFAVDRSRSVLVNLSTDVIDTGVASNNSDPPNGAVTATTPIGRVMAVSSDLGATLIVGDTGVFRVTNGVITKLTPLQTNTRRGHRDGAVANALFDGILDVSRFTADSFAIATPSAVRVLDSNDTMRTVVGSDRLQELGLHGRLHGQARLPSLACSPTRCVFASGDAPRERANSDDIALSTLSVDLTTGAVQVIDGREDQASTIRVVGAAANASEPGLASNGSVITRPASGSVLGSANGTIVAITGDGEDSYYIEDSGQLYRLGDVTSVDVTPGSLVPPDGPVSLAANNLQMVIAWPGQEAGAVNLFNGVPTEPFYGLGIRDVTGLAVDSLGWFWVVTAQGVQRIRDAVETIDVSAWQPGCLAGASVVEQDGVLSLYTADVCTGRLLRLQR